MKNLLSFFIIGIIFSVSTLAEENHETVFTMYSSNGKMNQNYEDLIVGQDNIYIKSLLVEAFGLVSKKIGYKYGANTLKNIDCTNFINLLFERIGLPVKNLTTAMMTAKGAGSYFSSDFSVVTLKSTKRKFFKPQTGDILAYNGHAVVVIDPQNCIAVNSSAWTVGNGPEGVQFHKITDKNRCDEGKWSYWDIKNGSHQWEVLFRHNDF